MGDEADDILRSFDLSESDRILYDPVKAKFEAHFVRLVELYFIQYLIIIRVFLM